MKTYMCLKVFSKDELIKLITGIITSHPVMAKDIKIRMINLYQQKIDEIGTMQEKCDLATLDGRMNWAMLQKQYISLQAAFDSILEAS